MCSPTTECSVSMRHKTTEKRHLIEEDHTEVKRQSLVKGGIYTDLSTMRRRLTQRSTGGGCVWVVLDNKAGKSV